MGEILSYGVLSNTGLPPLFRNKTPWFSLKFCLFFPDISSIKTPELSTKTSPLTPREAIFTPKKQIVYTPCMSNIWIMLYVCFI